MSVNTSPLLCEIKDHLATVTLNRPERRNALSLEMLESLESALGEFRMNSKVRVIVLRANGRVFCSGHDLTEMSHRDTTEFQRLFASCSAVMQQLRELPQPVIAEVQGLATAAGCQLAAACDLVVASADASFATPGVQLGLFCSTPMVPLMQAVPPKAALEMLLTGTPISAERAHALGLVNRVVAIGELETTVRQLADRISEFSPPVIALGKRLFYETLQKTEKEAYAQACEVMTRNAVMDDAQEGIAAFLEKRRPTWNER